MELSMPNLKAGEGGSCCYCYHLKLHTACLIRALLMGSVHQQINQNKLVNPFRAASS